MKKIIILIISHGVVAFAGFAAGIYVLPILTAPPRAQRIRPRDAGITQ